MRINLTDEQINDIIRLRTVEKWGIRRIGEQFGVGYKPIQRLLSENGLDVKSIQRVKFTDAEKSAILEAYRSGVGANGIPKRLGLKCSATPVIGFLRDQGVDMRDRSAQQYARMSRSTPEQIAHLTKRAHDATRGRTKTEPELHLAAKSREGKISKRSKFEPIVWDVLRERFDDVSPGLAIDRYNLDFAVNGNVAVEVFGGGWSISDKLRIDRYITRTKKIAERGFNTVFIMMIGVDPDSLDWDEFIRTVKLASGDPSSQGKYWMVWGDAQGSSGLSGDIDRSAFVPPFINVRDSATGRYKRVPR